MDGAWVIVVDAAIWRWLLIVSAVVVGWLLVAIVVTTVVVSIVVVAMVVVAGWILCGKACHVILKIGKGSSTGVEDRRVKCVLP